MIDGVIFNPLSIIDTEGGDVLHALKSSDHGFSGFGRLTCTTANFSGFGRPKVVQD